MLLDRDNVCKLGGATTPLDLDLSARKPDVFTGDELAPYVGSRWNVPEQHFVRNTLHYMVKYCQHIGAWVPFTLGHIAMFLSPEDPYCTEYNHATDSVVYPGLRLLVRMDMLKVDDNNIFYPTEHLIRRINERWSRKRVQQPLGQAQGIAQAAESGEHEDR